MIVLLQNGSITSYETFLYRLVPPKEGLGPPRHSVLSSTCRRHRITCLGRTCLEDQATSTFVGHAALRSRRSEVMRNGLATASARKGKRGNL